MQVRVGWSGETQHNVWEKADISLDEGDLLRLLADADVPPDRPLPTSVVHKLLQNEAEILLLSKLKDAVGFPAEKASDRQNVLSRQNEAILGALKKASA